MVPVIWSITGNTTIFSEVGSSLWTFTSLGCSVINLWGMANRVWLCRRKHTLIQSIIIGRTTCTFHTDIIYWVIVTTFWTFGTNSVDFYGCTIWARDTWFGHSIIYKSILTFWTDHGGLIPIIWRFTRQAFITIIIGFICWTFANFCLIVQIGI